MLAALALLSLLGIRYPLQMLPLMLYEMAWKVIWMASIALPAWASDQMTAGIADLFFECVGVVVLLFVIPWRYVWARYVKQPTEPWTRQPSWPLGHVKWTRPGSTMAPQMVGGQRRSDCPICSLSHAAGSPRRRLLSF